MKIKKIVSILATLALAVSTVSAALAAEVTLLNVSYDPTRELYTDINKAFANDWHVRSHDIEIERSQVDATALRAEIRHIQKLGPAVRVTLAIEGNPELVEAELTRDVFQSLGLQDGESVYVRPRQVMVFVEDYQI